MWRICVIFHGCAENVGVYRFLGSMSAMGVLVFFVHTCLVLMLSMHRAPATHFVRSFLIRRVFRIYPLCWTAIILVLATGLSDHRTNSLHTIGWRVIAANLLLVQNMLVAHSESNIVLGPLWSLPWEMQMYLVLPFFFLFLRRFDRLWVVLGIWLGAALLAVTVRFLEIPHTDGIIFPPIFISGMAAYRLLDRNTAQQRSPALPAWGWPLFILGIFNLEPLLVGKHTWIAPASSYCAAVNSCVCLALGLAIPNFAEVGSAWIVHPAQQIAKYSYGVYLLHIPAMMLVFSYLTFLPLALKIVGALAVTALFSFVSFHAIENPLIQLGKRLTRPVQAAGVAASLPVPESPPARL